MKKLVVSDALNRPVAVKVVRGKTSRTVDIYLAERVVNRTHGLDGIQEIRGPRVVRLMNRGGAPVFVAQDKMVIPGSEVR